DSVFVEDTAVVFDELALITRPGAASRRVETAAVAHALNRYRTERRIEAPATLDGGDVLVAGRSVFVGRSSRTKGAGVGAMRRRLERCGLRVTTVDLSETAKAEGGVTCCSLIFDA